MRGFFCTTGGRGKAILGRDQELILKNLNMESYGTSQNLERDYGPLVPPPFASSSTGRRVFQRSVCATLAFTFLISHLYLTGAMSCFFHPTTRVSPAAPTVDCLSSQFFHRERSLNILLSTMPACHIFQQILAIGKSWLRSLRPTDPRHGERAEVDTHREAPSRLSR